MTDYEIEMELDEAEKECREHPPVNLSYWNAGSEYKEKIKKILKFDSEHDVFDYYYYFPEDVKEAIADKLGFSADDRKKAFFHALTQSTLSIAMISILLSKMPAKLGIITPYYFSVPDCCDTLKMDYTIFDDFMENINESFDADLLLQSDCNAFWFTSPLNSCSIYFKQRVTEGIQKLLNAGKLVILDESLCINGRELSRTFGIQENLIYIYSPHKALGIQGIKFSVLVVHKKYYDAINSLNDSFGGSINYSCRQGYHHFISPNFGECLSIYNQFWAENLSLVRHILSDYDFATVSSEVSGHYAMIFIDHTIDDRHFVDAMKMLMKDKGYFAYPGVMQCLDLKHRFCFRLNLLLNKADVEQGLRAVLDYFKDNRGADRWFHS